MSFLTFLAERRSHSDQNTEKDDVLKTIRGFADPEAVWMSFVHHPKLGINPINTYNTPTAIYAYHLSDYHKQILSKKSLDPIPYQADAPYIYFFTLNSDSYRILDSATYSNTDLEKDIRTIEAYFLQRVDIDAYNFNHPKTIATQIGIKKKNLTVFKNFIVKINKKQVDYQTQLDTSYKKLKIDLPRMNKELISIQQPLAKLIDEIANETITVEDYKNNAPKVALRNNRLFAARELESLLNAIKHHKFKRLSLSNKTPLRSLKKTIKYNLPMNQEVLSWEEFLNEYIEEQWLKDEKIISTAREIKAYIENYDNQFYEKDFDLSILQTEQLNHAMDWCKKRLKELNELSDSQKKKKAIIKERQVYSSYYDSLLQIKMSVRVGKKENLLHDIKKLTQRIDQQIKQYAAKEKEIKKAIIDMNDFLRFRSFRKDKDGLFFIIDAAARKHQRKLKTDNPLSYLWAYLYHCLPFLSTTTSSLSVNIWNHLFRNVLGVGAVLDRGIGFVHPNEKKQTVIFTKSIVRPLKMIQNKIQSDKELLLLTDIMKSAGGKSMAQLVGYADIEIVKNALKKYLFPNKDYYPFFTRPEFLHRVILDYEETALEELNQLKQVTQKQAFHVNSLKDKVQAYKNALAQSWINTFLQRKNRYVASFNMRYGSTFWNDIKNSLLVRFDQFLRELNK